MRVTPIVYTVRGTLTPLSSSVIEPGASGPEFPKTGAFWRATPRWLYLDAVVPFPAHYGVALNGLGLEKVAGDNLVRRRELEVAGKGWWTLDFVLTRPDGSIDPDKPSRLTEVKVVINPGPAAWA